MDKEEQSPYQINYSNVSRADCTAQLFLNTVLIHNDKP